MIHTGAACFIICEDRVLLGKRIGERSGSGLYAAPGGKVEAGEEPLTSVVREVKEETDITLEPTLVHPFTFSSRINESGVPSVTLYFVAALDTRPEVVNTEPEKCEDWDWYTLREVRELEMFEASKGILLGTRPPIPLSPHDIIHMI